MIARLFRARTLAQSFAVATTLLVFVVISATLLVVRSRVEETLREGLEARGLSIARSIGAVATPSLLAYNYPALQIAADGALGDTGLVYVVIHDKEGVVAGVAGRAPAIVGVSSALARVPREAGFSDRIMDNASGGSEQVLEVVVPVRVEGANEPWGAVRVGLSCEQVNERLRRIVGHLVALGLTLAVGAIAAAIWVARKATAPLRDLAKGTEALSSGDTAHRISVAGAREFVELGRAFNVMMDRVQEKARESSEFQAALESLNSTLEEQVLERTRALEESEAQYKTLVEHSPDMILIVQDKRVRFVNRAFEETFGVTMEEACAPGFDLVRIFDSSSSALVRGRIDVWLRGEATASVEVLGRDASGKIRHLELRGSRIEYRGRPAAECLLIDTTEARQLRDRLAETEKLRALGELAGGVAHDFNNLLGAILGRVQLLRRRGFSSDVDRDLTVIEKAAQDGRETIRRIQDFSRIRRDRKFVPVDLREVIRDSLEITRSRWKSEAERRNISFQVSVETEDVPPVLGNGAELREVFTNLILNAVDAMPQGGKLRLACRGAGDKVVAEVEDSGVGMTAEIRKQLFDPFFTTKGTRGMGLGLSVAYGIMTRHEGRIEVKTAMGRGTTFVLELPVAREGFKAAGGDGAALPQLLRPGRILVIDDEAEVGEVVRDVLVSEGHSVDMAVCGADGIRLATVSSYDMVFTDLGMPDMSGWEVAERIGQVRPGLPVALVTGWGTSLDEADVREKGIAAVVHKPFDITDLIRTATEILANTDAGRGQS
jgi:PAS domain S-box-containing protein